MFFPSSFHLIKAIFCHVRVDFIFYSILFQTLHKAYIIFLFQLSFIIFYYLQLSYHLKINIFFFIFSVPL